MNGPLPLAIYITADLPSAADWEGSAVFDTTTNTIKYSDGSTWHSVIDDVNLQASVEQLIEVSPYHFGTGFRAEKNANQTGIADNTLTQVTFQTEIFDVGGHFASNGWTPPAGLVQLSASLLVTGSTGVAVFANAAVVKNGAILSQGFAYAEVGQNIAIPSISFTDLCDGNDVYTISTQLDVNTGTVTVNQSATATYFTGAWIGPPI